VFDITNSFMKQQHHIATTVTLAVSASHGLHFVTQNAVT